MFPNLNAELARKKIKTKELAKILNVSIKTANNKLSGRSEFTLSEIITIAAMFPKATIAELFKKEEEVA